MSTSTDAVHDRSLHLPVQAAPIRRDGWGTGSPESVPGGVEAADCGDLTGMARELCYASEHGIYF